MIFFEKALDICQEITIFNIRKTREKLENKENEMKNATKTIDRETLANVIDEYIDGLDIIDAVLCYDEKSGEFEWTSRQTSNNLDMNIIQDYEGFEMIVDPDVRKIDGKTWMESAGDIWINQYLIG